MPPPARRTRSRARARTGRSAERPRRPPRARFRSPRTGRAGRAGEPGSVPRPRCSRRNAIAQDRGDRAEEDLEVEPQGPAVDVLEVRPQTVEERLAETVGDLPEPGDPGLHREALALPGLEAGDLARQHRSRSDQAHLATQDVQELRLL